MDTQPFDPDQLHRRNPDRIRPVRRTGREKADPPVGGPVRRAHLRLPVAVAVEHEYDPDPFKAAEVGQRRLEVALRQQFDHPFVAGEHPLPGGLLRIVSPAPHETDRRKRELHLPPPISRLRR